MTGPGAIPERLGESQGPLSAHSRLALQLAVIGIAVILLAIGVYVAWRRRRKSPEEIERLRRLDIHRRGRITAGYIVDLIEPQAPAGTFLVYKYDVSGVTYEVAQDVTLLPTIASAARRLLGHITHVKFDPRNPTNSIIACEQWSGITDGDVGSRSDGPTLGPTTNALQKP
jgi:hypothetical protein